MSNLASRGDSRRKTGRLHLFIIVLFLVAGWGFALPRVAKWDAIREREERFTKAGINPAAIYYTDHPSMREMESRVTRKLAR